MAFQAMMGGSECSTSNNPLNSLLKQQQTDHSLHHNQPSTYNNPQNAGQSMRSMTPASIGQLNGQEAEQFFQQQNGGGMGMETMRRELENVARGSQGAIKGDRGTHRIHSLNSYSMKS